MELSYGSMRYPEGRRPMSSKFVELHVLYVPDDQWNIKLNKVPAEAVESFISAGFIRVYPDITLETLRSELGLLLGTERRINKFSFLKCVGRSLALVQIKQERDLKVKTFAPPYAPQPELYLLPMVENDSSVCTQTLTPDSSSLDPQTYYPPKTCSLPTGTKEGVKLPLIPQCSQQPPPPPTPSPEEEEEDSYSSTEAEGENEEEPPLLSPRRPDWARDEPPQNQSTTQSGPQVKEVDSAQVKQFPAKEETSGEKKPCYRRNKAPRDSGVPESLKDTDSGFSLTQDSETSLTNLLQTFLLNVNSKKGCSDDPGELLKRAGRDELMEEIKLAREERKRLEWTRQELLRKGKDLLAQNRHRRNQARDSWKKKYFETKKATAPLEETLKNLRQELETFYNKLLHQLQARDGRGRPPRQGRSSTKNELIIQIMTESHEIDNLKRKVEDAKMKLVTEIKLRKQAATELRALKAELAQKRSQAHCGPAAPPVTTRDRTQTNI
ncbi:spermatogenesis-associated protein 1 [Diretmus argenteus]